MYTAFISLVAPENIPADAIAILQDYQEKDNYLALQFIQVKDDKSHEMFGLEKVMFLTDKMTMAEQLFLKLKHLYCWADVDTVIPFRNAEDIKKNRNIWLNNIARRTPHLKHFGKIFASLMLIDIYLRYRRV